MCGLCGIFGEEAHWSSSGVIGGTTRRQRLFRVDALTQVLALKHLKVSDFQGVSYLLLSPTGAQFIVKEMGELWLNVEKTLGYKMDPLDDALIERFKEKTKL